MNGINESSLLLNCIIFADDTGICYSLKNFETLITQSHYEKVIMSK